MVDLVLMVDFLDLVVIVNVVHMVDLVVMVVKGGVQISSPTHLLVLKFCFFLLVVSIPCLKMVGMPMFNLQEIDVHANNSTLHIIIGILLSP